MAVLENPHHNFPRLAEQSGFNFNLHRGKVNWSEIESLNIKDIIERRNFELLEQNLANVTNCNLERENDFKILDQNFVKLFQLAQLGIDYLSYCEMYLDKCVVLLQEQLIVSQDECELLKKEIQKRKEVSKSKSKNKALNYQCEKCFKVFISDVYLKFHEKRRHSSTNTSETFDESPQKCSCNCQKNEDSTRLSTSISTQTLYPNEMTVPTQEKEENNMKMEHLLKIEKLEHELQDLKERFKKAESTLSEKAEPTKPNAFHSINVPMMLLPSYITQHGYCGINSGCQIPVPEVCQLSSTFCSENQDTVKSKPLTEDQEKTELIILAEKCKVLTEQKTNSITPEIIENIQKNPSEKVEELESEKENVDPKKTQLPKNLTKPLPPPRLKKVIQQQSELKIAPKIDGNVENKNGGLSKQIIVKSTPLKEKLKNETNLEIFEGSIGNISEINTSKATSLDSFQNKKSVFESEPKSYVKKIVAKDSSIQKLGRNFRKSLNSLCDSISSTEKETVKNDTNIQNIRTTLVDGLNNHLQQLGISSEWSGIPKKTLKQKLRAWKHQRKLSSKGNSLYPVTRKKIEVKVFEKLKKNFKRKKTTNSLNKQALDNSTASEIQNIEDQFEFVKNSNCLMYATDTDSESTVSDSINVQEKELNSLKAVIVEEITSSEERTETKNHKESNKLFQAKGTTLDNAVEENNQKPVLVNNKNKLFIDSDTDSIVLENFEHKNSKKSLVNDKDKVIEDLENEKLPFKFLVRGKTEHQSILKDGEGFQSKPIANTQKKVLFSMYSKSLEEELSDDPTDDDRWSLKSDWEKNAG